MDIKGENNNQFSIGKIWLRKLDHYPKSLYTENILKYILNFFTCKSLCTKVCSQKFCTKDYSRKFMHGVYARKAKKHFLARTVLSHTVAVGWTTGYLSKNWSKQQKIFSNGSVQSKANKNLKEIQEQIQYIYNKQ